MASIFNAELRRNAPIEGEYSLSEGAQGEAFFVLCNGFLSQSIWCSKQSTAVTTCGAERMDALMKRKGLFFGSMLICFGAGLLMAMLFPARVTLAMLAAVLLVVGFVLIQNC